MQRVHFLVFLLAAALSAAQDLQTPSTEPMTADAIMARVASNQDRSESLRKQFVYRQRIHIISHKPNGRLLREETADYDVVPTPDGTQKQLKLITGRYWNKGKYETFQEEPIPDSDSLDANLVKSFRDDLSNDKTKDGLAKDLFPLSSEEQKEYQFKLLGREMLAGRNSWELICRGWVSMWFINGKKTESGFPLLLEPSSGYTRCSFSTARFQSHWKILALSTRM